jgi:hypothetical protein
MKGLYISGKISGLDPIVYKRNFANAKSALLSQENTKTFRVFSPIDIRPVFGIKKYWFYMIADLYTLFFKCDTIYMLPNWKDSKGAKIELFFALLTFKKII